MCVCGGGLHRLVYAESVPHFQTKVKLHNRTNVVLFLFVVNQNHFGRQ